MAEHAPMAGERTQIGEVTPKMIEAGLAALEQWRQLAPGERLAAVYRAMLAVAPPSRSRASRPTATMLQALEILGHGPETRPGKK